MSIISKSHLYVSLFASAFLVLNPCCSVRRADPGGPPPITAPLISETTGGESGKIEPGFEALLRNSPADRFHAALVDLTDQVDLPALGRRLREAGLSKKQRRTAVIDALESVASGQQEALRPFLDRLREEGTIDYIRPVAIVNRLVVEGSAEGLLALAGRPEVARILPEWSSKPARRSSGLLSGDASTGLGERFESWAVEALGARDLWERGLDGSGVVVAAIDTGVIGGHEQLAGRRLPGGRGWFDSAKGRKEPYDDHGHGTAVLTQAVGGNPDGKILGLAPGASWAMALGNADNHYSRIRMTLAADWILRAARPDVLINAWSHDESPCTKFDLPFINAWKAAEIFVIFPAGNAGPSTGTGESPAQLSGTYPDGGPVFSVAALVVNLSALPESSRGPSACGSHLFPAIALPGGDLPTVRRGLKPTYGLGNGTSLSAGLMGGAAALLLQADPELSPDELEEIFLASARDLPPEGWDIYTGAGILDLPAALRTVTGFDPER